MYLDDYSQNFKLAISEEIIDSARKGVSLQLLGVYMDGRSTYIKFFARNREFHLTHLDFFKETEVLYLSMPEGEIWDEKDSVIRLLESVGIRGIGSLELGKVVRGIEEALGNRRLLVVIDDITHDLPKSLVDVLLQLRNRNRGTVSYVFLLGQGVSTKVLGRLEQCAWERVIYFGRYDVQDFESTFGVRDAETLSNREIDIDWLLELAGGHPGLLKQLLNSWDVHGGRLDRMSGCDSVMRVCEELVMRLPEMERQTLVTSMFLKGKGSERLKHLGLLSERGTIRSLVMQEYLKAQLLNVDLGEEMVLMGVDVSRLFSRSERLVLMCLAAEGGGRVHRDQIAQALWGEQWEVKYSDWAIDKVISGLRKHLMMWPWKIETVAKYGYRLVRS